MIAAAGLSIRQGRRVFPTVKPVSRTAGAKTQPSGRAASRVAVTQHRWPVSIGTQSWPSPVAGVNRRPIVTHLQKGKTGGEAVTSKTHRNRLATSKDQ